MSNTSALTLWAADEKVASNLCNDRNYLTAALAGNPEGEAFLAGMNGGPLAHEIKPAATGGYDVSLSVAGADGRQTALSYQTGDTPISPTAANPQEGIRARILDSYVTVYNGAGAEALPINSVQAGTEVILGKAEKVGKSERVAVSLQDGTQGYISAEARVFTIQTVKLAQKEVLVYEQPSAQSPVKHTYNQGAAFTMENLEEFAGKQWIRISDETGLSGYIPGETKVLMGEAAVEASPEKDIVCGALWCIGGIVVTAATYSAAQDGGTYIVAWGAILFGGIQFLKGLFRYIAAQVSG